MQLISFGELRRFATQWGVLPDVVERAYARDWLIKGIFDRAELAGMFVLRGETALGKAYFADYPLSEGIESGIVQPSPQPSPFQKGMDLQVEFETAAREASNASGLKLALALFEQTRAEFSFVGPLGRRSAAQPHITIRFAPITLRREAREHKLIYPFSDACEANVRAVALEELAAERIVLLARAPRVRDIFDLWFIITHRVERETTFVLAHEIAREKNSALPQAGALFAEPVRANLTRAWDHSLKQIRQPPSFAQVEADLNAWLGEK